jgi:long-chain fatty acid transport protein
MDHDRSSGSVQPCRKLAAGFALALAVTLFTGAVRAGGLEVPDLGTAAIGRGTAMVARADDLSAFYYNPAGLSKQAGINALLGANIVNLNVDYERYGSGGCYLDRVGGEFIPDCEADQYAASGQNPGSILIADPALDHGVANGGTRFGSVSSSKRLGASPMIVVQWGDVAKVKGLAIAVGLIPPSSFGTPTYPAGGPQRYALIDANLLIVYPGAGFAYAPNRYFRVGAVFLSGIGRFRQSQAIRPLPQPLDQSFNEDPAGDAVLAIDASDPFIPTGIIGVMSQPLDWLELGLSVKLPADIRAEGDVTYRAPHGAGADLPDSYLKKDKVTLSQSFPFVVRAGARFVHPRFDVEADFVFEQWSSLESFAVDMDSVLFDGMYSDLPMPDAEIPKRFRDVYSVRFGGDVELWPEHLTARVGGFYQSSAYPANNETFSVDFPFGEQVGVGGGLTWHAIIRGFNYLDVHAGYMHVFQPDVIVERGVLQQQGLPMRLSADESVQIANVVNGGRYRVSLNMFGLALEGHFPLRGGR